MFAAFWSILAPHSHPGIGVSGGAAAVVLVVALAAVTPGDWVGIGSWVAAAAVDVASVVIVAAAAMKKAKKGGKA